MCALTRANIKYAGDPGLVPTRRSSLAFRWAIAMDGAVREANVQVRADHAVESGVPLPDGWRVALRARGLGLQATEAGRTLEVSVGVTELECKLAASSFQEP